ncbi:MAG TPA: glycosyltransferase family 4 protein [Thermoplasmata archaeon]|nr:glycosyltransferase family 4 protein [Thermoplasmata archaeon]
MKILYFGGPTTHMRKFATTFASRHEVRTAVFRESGMPNEVLIGGTSKATRWTPALAVPLVRKLIEREKPDLVHSFYLLPFSFLGARAGASPHVISAMGDDIYPPGPHSQFRNRLLHLTGIPRDWHLQTSRRFDAAVVECEHARQRMEKLGYAGAKVSVITWGPDCTVFRPEARDVRLRERLLGDLSQLVICSRAMWKEYGVHDLVDAFASVREEAVLVLLGSGPEAAALRRQAERRGIGGRIRFIGQVRPDEVAAYVASADVMVSPSYTDTVSTSLLEGMACGVPSVATDVGGTGEFVKEGENGLLLPPGRPELIAEALDRLLSDGSLMARLGRKGREVVLEKADWAKRWREVQALYESVAKR